MNQDIAEPPKRRRGRPVTFDRRSAVGHAMRLFWERGYEGTTFDDLIGAMGISPSSFYNAFGSKERLYQEAVDAYMAEADAWLARELGAAKDARSAIQRMLDASIRVYTQPGQPAGCMVSTACINVPPALAPLKDYMARQRRNSETALAARIRRGMEEGDTPPDTDADALAAYYSAVSRGLVIQVQDGIPLERLQQVVHLAMRAWPPAPVRARPASPLILEQALQQS